MILGRTVLPYQRYISADFGRKNSSMVPPSSIPLIFPTTCLPGSRLFSAYFPFIFRLSSALFPPICCSFSAYFPLTFHLFSAYFPPIFRLFSAYFLLIFRLFCLAGCWLLTLDCGFTLIRSLRQESSKGTVKRDIYDSKLETLEMFRQGVDKVQIFRAVGGFFSAENSRRTFEIANVISCWIDGRIFCARHSCTKISDLLRVAFGLLWTRLRNSDKRVIWIFPTIFRFSLSHVSLPTTKYVLNTLLPVSSGRLGTHLIKSDW